MKEKIICLDPGHPSDFPDGSINWGAVAADGTKEIEINLTITQLVAHELKEIGYLVILTRDNNEKLVKNTERIKIGKENGAQIIIRLHCDQDRHQDINKRGCRTFYPPKEAEAIYEKSYRVATIIHRKIIKETQLRDGGVVDERETKVGQTVGMLVGTREANKYGIPTVLVEMVYLSNPDDTAWILSSINQGKMARGIAVGIKEVFESGILKK